MRISDWSSDVCSSDLLLAENLRRWSDKPEADCAELFRRMVFNAAVTNNDDHPRNHALLRRQKGWRLSPAYDLVPAPVVSRSEDSRVGKECVSTCRSRWSPYH